MRQRKMVYSDNNDVTCVLCRLEDGVETSLEAAGTHLEPGKELPALSRRGEGEAVRPLASSSSPAGRNSGSAVPGLQPEPEIF